MSEVRSFNPKSNRSLLTKILWVGGGVVLTGAVLLVSVLLQTPIGSAAARSLQSAFALNSVQTMWYITRAAGLTAYLLFWLSTAWGLAVSSKILDAILHRSFTYDFHQFISLLAIGFTALHIIVLMFDSYLPYSLAQILVPFLSPYRPLWVGIGVIGFYLTLLVTITFYIRSRIGMKAFRVIHVFSLLAYLAATVHSFFAGTDTPLPAVMLMYAGSFLVVVFLMGYWIIMSAQKNKAKSVPVPAKITQPSRPIIQSRSRRY
jgi:methionine sulfoxide reductase heme-binding subunit